MADYIDSKHVEAELNCIQLKRTQAESHGVELWGFGWLVADCIEPESRHTEAESDCIESKRTEAESHEADMTD